MRASLGPVNNVPITFITHCPRTRRGRLNGRCCQATLGLVPSDINTPVVESSSFTLTDQGTRQIERLSSRSPEA